MRGFLADKGSKDRGDDVRHRNGGVNAIRRSVGLADDDIDLIVVSDVRVFGPL